MAELDLSIVVPLFNEELNVELMYERIVEGVEPTQLTFEVIFVDDGSADRTFEIAADIARRDSRLRVIKFRRNYGQTPAMAAGIDHSKGNVVVTLDGDLQNDPADIPKFLEKINEGNDLVVGWRHNRKDKLVTRKIPSRIANWMIGKVTGVPIKDNGCSLKAYRREIIQKIPLYSEMHRFIPAMTSLSGAKIAEIQVRHHARQFGESKYGLSRVYKVLMDMLTIKTLVSFGPRPLRWFALLALIPAILTLIFGGIFIASLFDGIAFSVPLAGTTFLLGTLVVFLVMTGALCELIYAYGDADLNELASLSSIVNFRKSKRLVHSSKSAKGKPDV